MKLTDTKEQRTAGNSHIEMQLLQVTIQMPVYFELAALCMLTWIVANFTCEHCTTTDLDAVDLGLKHVQTARFMCFAPFACFCPIVHRA